MPNPLSCYLARRKMRWAVRRRAGIRRMQRIIEQLAFGEAADVLEGDVVPMFGVVIDDHNRRSS